MEYGKLSGGTKPRMERWLKLVCEDCSVEFDVRKSDNRVAKHKMKCSLCSRKMKGHKGTDGKLLPQTKEKKAIQSSWDAMTERTTSVESENYPRYGGRGIAIEFKSFGEFYEWSIANGYKLGLYIERLDNDGNYSKKNCAWKTALEQAQNRTSGKTNKTGLAGVVRRKDRFTASVRYNNKNYGCGTYDTPEEAHKAYIKRKLELAGS